MNRNAHMLKKLSMGLNILLDWDQMNSTVSLLLSLLQSSLLLNREQSTLNLDNVVKNNVSRQFIQNIMAFTHFKPTIQKSNISNYPICYDKAEQV